MYIYTKYLDTYMYTHIGIIVHIIIIIPYSRTLIHMYKNILLD